VVTALAAWIGLHGVGVADAFRHAQLVFRAPVAAVRIAVTETGEDQVVVGGKRQAATDHAGEHWAILGYASGLDACWRHVPQHYGDDLCYCRVPGWWCHASIVPRQLRGLKSFRSWGRTRNNC
jgi:hypothetical protein